MNKALAVAAFVFAANASLVSADTVSVTSEMKGGDNGTLSSTMLYRYNLNPLNTLNLTVTVAGKTCTFLSSANGSVPGGCNYSITVDPSGSIKGSLAAGNSACTQSSQVAASCK